MGAIKKSHVLWTLLLQLRVFIQTFLNELSSLTMALPVLSHDIVFEGYPTCIGLCKPNVVHTGVTTKYAVDLDANLISFVTELAGCCSGTNQIQSPILSTDKSVIQ
jgi:hypothetical protein